MKYAVRYFLVLLIVLAAALALSACSDEEVSPANNPFDQHRTPADTTTQSATDSASIVGLHKYIFSQSCATPGCHDGSFEPDFRTVQSTYSTLVYHPSTKNYTDTSKPRFPYRVVPGNAEASWLWERVTTDDQELGRMPLYDPMLSPSELAAIRSWIDNGALDLNGAPPSFPNLEPEVVAYFGLNTNTPPQPMDRNRPNGPTSYFLVPDTMTFDLVFGIADDSTAYTDLQVNMLRLSTDPLDFSGAQEFNATLYPAPITRDRNGQSVTFAWSVRLDASTLQPGQRYYMRYYVQDDYAGRTDTVEFPNNQAPQPIKDYASFLVTN